MLDREDVAARLAAAVLQTTPASPGQRPGQSPDMIATCRYAVAVYETILGMLPKPLITTDQVIQLGIDNVVSEEAKKEGRTLEGMGIAGETIGTILPSYLWRYRIAGQYTRRVAA